MPDLLLATCADLPTGDEEAVLVDLFAERGIQAAWAVWDDPEVPWGDADLVAIRTTWDYTERLGDFLAWADGVAARTRLINEPAVLRWNTHKGYLLDLDRWGLPVVPTRVVTSAADLDRLLADHAEAVVKPAVGVGGNGLVLWRAGDPLPGLDGEDWVVQPLIATVRTRGEVSVFVMGDRAVGQVGKRPAADEVRIHQHRGGTFAPEPLEAEAVALAERAVAVVSTELGSALPYARVDLLQHEGRYVVSEVEVAEPSLYVEVEPAIVAAYVDTVAGLLGR